MAPLAERKNGATVVAGQAGAPLPDYGDTIRRFRQARGLRQEELARLVGVSRNAVAGWETGHARPDLNTVVPLCAALKISLARFFGQEKPRTARERQVLDLFFALNEGDREVIQWQMEALLQRRAEQARSRMRPVVSLFRNDLGVAAGFGAPLGDKTGEEIVLVADGLAQQADEVLTVSGRSMEPDYDDGDLVLVQYTDELRPGEVGVFLVNGEGYIKEYQPEGLVSHNPDYPVMRFAGEENVRCVGRVLGKVTEDMLPTQQELQQVNEKAATAGKKDDR